MFLFEVSVRRGHVPARCMESSRPEYAAHAILRRLRADGHLILDSDEVTVYRPEDETLGADLVTTVGQVLGNQVGESDWTPAFVNDFYSL